MTTSLTPLDVSLADVAFALAAPFSHKALGWRAGTTGKNSDHGQALPYIDARNVQERLDSVVGIANWRDEYVEVLSAGKVVSVRCKLSLRLAGEWITKEDAAQMDGYNSEASAEMAIKGAYSDALKRAAVKFGVARYLYSFAPPWVELENGRYLPYGFNGLVYLAEHMVPANEVAELKALHEERADAVLAAVEPRQRAVPETDGFRQDNTEDKPADAAQGQAGAVPATERHRGSNLVSSGQPANGTALEDDAAYVASIREKLARGASLAPLLTYLQGPKALQKLTLVTKEVLLAEIEKKLAGIT